jgi:KaiC/GvpD/RAD55 family RecA-like ATPase
MRASSFLDAALAYQRAGLHVIPVEPKGKRPILASWREYVERRPTEAEITDWWSRTPDANVALLMGRGVFALDIDGPEGEAALAAAGIELPDDAPQTATGKGRHVFMAGLALNSVGVLPKVDTRSDGGYVVVSPSVHPNGTKYAWLGRWPTGQLPSAPPALLELVARPTKPGAAAVAPGVTSADWVSAALSGVGEGSRDAMCARLAGYFWGLGATEATVEIICQGFGERCEPAFPPDQVSKTVASIVRRDGGPQVSVGPAASLDDAIEEFLLEMGLPANERRVRPTDMPTLDRLLSGGFSPGELILLGARPGVGKTALSCQWARRTAKTGAGVLFISREMTRVALVRRLLVQESQVRASALKTGDLSDIERSMLAAAIERIRYTPFRLTQDVSSIEGLNEELARFEAGQLGLVVVDYLQLMRGPADMRDKRATVEYVSSELKALAMRYEVPMLVLSSLRRLAKRKDGDREPPDMSDLRESGELEHSGDVVLIMERDFGSEEADLVVAKNRDGRVGRIKLRFTGELMQFEEVWK